MKNLINNNTDLLVVFFAGAITVLTFIKIMDVKDFLFIVGMVFSYKFGKNQRELPVDKTGDNFA